MQYKKIIFVYRRGGDLFVDYLEFMKVIDEANVKNKLLVGIRRSARQWLCQSL